LKEEKPSRSRYVRLLSRPARGHEPIEVRIPLRNLAKELETQLPRAAVYRDLPRGRKRPGWKREFARSLEAAGHDLSGVAESQIMEAIRGYRAEKKRLPEITVGGPRRSS
jgi:hypothetical protein